MTAIDGKDILSHPLAGIRKSNNNPRVVGRLFLNTVKSVEGCPMLLRTDRGTENGLMDGAKSYYVIVLCSVFCVVFYILCCVLVIVLCFRVLCCVLHLVLCFLCLVFCFASRVVF